MNITPNKLTIAQLFATTNEQFIVPSYQRRYAWGANQFFALYEDIDMLKENDGHLLGMIILHTSYHTGDINKPELVDGQQRMTTLVLFLKAFETVYRNKGKEDKANDIRKMILCKGLDEIDKPKLKLGDLDNNDFQQLILSSQLQGITNINIKNAYEGYTKRLNSLEIESLNKLFYKLTNVAVLLRLDVGMAQDAYKLFETINNRGLKLTPTDIIKNFLLGHAAKMNDNPILEKVKTLWSKIIINLDGIDSDDFLRQFICSSLYRKVTKSMLVYEFKKYYLQRVERADLLSEYEYYQIESDEETEEEEFNNISDENETETIREELEISPSERKFTILEFLEQLVNLSDIYKKISLGNHENIKVARSLKNLNNILSKPSYIFLMHFLLDTTYDTNKKITVLKYFETLMLRRHICGEHTSENDDLFAKIVPFLGEADILIKIKSFMEENDSMPTDNDFEVSLPKYQFKGKLVDRAKYILESIEYFKRNNTSELVISSNEEVHLEHIIPQTIHTKKAKKDFGDWVTYLGDKSIAKHKKYAFYIGNMTLLGGALNIQASNNPYERKKDSYGQSSFLITQELANLRDFKFEQVENRGDQLASIALKIWKA